MSDDEDESPASFSSDDGNSFTSHAKCPAYTLYHDKDVDIAIQSGHIPVELRHRLIRGTVHNMVSVACSPPWNRLPATNEVIEMAKSLVVTYPCLKDDKTGHVCRTLYTVYSSLFSLL